jgi:hypothetical protein
MSGPNLPSEPMNFTRDEVNDSIAHHEGLCVGCGCHTDGIEPGIQNANCDDCGQPMVFAGDRIIALGLGNVPEDQFED